MSINAIIIWTVVASLIVSGQPETKLRYKFTRNQYYGLWYIVRVMIPAPHCDPVMVCPFMNILERGYNSWKFQQSEKQIRSNGTIEVVRSVRGKILDSKIYLEVNPKGDNIVMNVTSYNDGKDLILLGSENRLISRNRTPSSEARRAFKRLVQQANMHIYAPDHDDCY